MFRTLEPQDEGDEADEYLKRVMQQSKQEGWIPISNSSPEVISRPSFEIPLSDAQISEILEEFKRIKSYSKLWENNLGVSNYFELYDETTWMKMIQENGVLTEHIVKLDQVSVCSLLEFTDDSLEENYAQISQWVYALLVKLEKPLLIDSQATLMSILKKSINQLPNPHAKVLIAIISHYFGQRYF